MKRTVIFVLSILLSSLSVLAQTAPVITITFSPDGVSASGITAGGDATYFAVLQEQEEFSIASTRRDETISDSNSDGVVRLEMPDGVPMRSIWAVVDMTTGAYALAVPQGYRLRLAEDTQDHGAKRDNNGHVSHIERAIGYGELVVVRPGEGVWLGSAGQGGPNDADFTDDGKLTMDFDDLHPGGKNKAGASPGHLLSNDTIVIIDPVEMQVFAARINEK